MSEPLPPSPELGYEPKDASIGTILITGALVLGSVFTAMAAASVIYLGRYSTLPAGGSRLTSFKDGVNERSSLGQEIDALRLESAKHLTEYGWNDRTHGTVHLPLGRAMDLILQEGAARPPAEGKK